MSPWWDELEPKIDKALGKPESVKPDEEEKPLIVQGHIGDITVADDGTFMVQVDERTRMKLDTFKLQETVEVPRPTPNTKRIYPTKPSWYDGFVEITEGTPIPPPTKKSDILYAVTPRNRYIATELDCLKPNWIYYINPTHILITPIYWTVEVGNERDYKGFIRLGTGAHKVKCYDQRFKDFIVPIYRTSEDSRDGYTIITEPRSEPFSTEANNLFNFYDYVPISHVVSTFPLPVEFRASMGY